MTPFEANLAVTGATLVAGGLIAWGITHLYHLKDKKDSEQKIKRLEESMDKILNNLNMAEKLLSKFENAWKAEFPDQLIPPKLIAVFTDATDFIKKTATLIKNYNYTAKGGIKSGGAAETIIEVPEGEIPPIIDDR